jgi:hypothetical protein
MLTRETEDGAPAAPGTRSDGEGLDMEASKVKTELLNKPRLRARMRATSWQEHLNQRP